MLDRESRVLVKSGARDGRVWCAQCGGIVLHWLIR